MKLELLLDFGLLDIHLDIKLKMQLRRLLFFTHCIYVNLYIVKILDNLQYCVYFIFLMLEFQYCI